MEFIKGINKNMGLKYVQQKRNVLRREDNIVDWNIWKNKDRKEEIRGKVEEIGRDWIQVKNVSLKKRKGRVKEQNEWEKKI